MRTTPNTYLDILNAVPGGHLALDHAQNIIFSNSWMQDRLCGDPGGTAQSNPIGAPIAKIMHPGKSRRLLSTIANCIDTGHAGFLSHHLNPHTLQLCDPNTGRAIPHSISVTPVKLDGHQPICLLHVQDVAHKLEREIKQRKQSTDLKLLSQDMSHVLYAASHDLRTPVRNLQSLLHMLKEDEAQRLSADGNAYIEELQSCTSRLWKLMDGILDWSRLQTGHLETPPLCDIGLIITETMQEFSSELNSLGGILIFQHIPNAQIDEFRARQLFQNLVHNAILYRSAAPPQITITGHNLGTMTEFSVKDNGIGIEPEHRTKVFEMFKRLHLYAERAGSGLGLPICRKIVEDLGGKIWVADSDSGCDIRFTLPSAMMPKDIAKFA